jgi:hypothetical protein
MEKGKCQYMKRIGWTHFTILSLVCFMEAQGTFPKCRFRITLLLNISENDFLNNKTHTYSLRYNLTIVLDDGDNG